MCFAVNEMSPYKLQKPPRRGLLFRAAGAALNQKPNKPKFYTKT